MLSLEKLSELSPEDRLVAIEELGKVGYKVQYNTALVEFFNQAYDWQKDYFNSVGDNAVVGLIAGNRVGKSEAAAAYVACAATGVWPEWYTGYRFKNKPIKIFVCGSSGQQLRGAMQEKLFGTPDRNNLEDIGTGFLPKDTIENWGKGRDGSASTITVTHVTGRKTRIEFLQYTQSDSAFQGSAVDLAVIDEEPGEKFFQQILKRVAQAPHSGKPGYVITAFTPEQQDEGFVMKQMWNLPTIIKYGDTTEDGYTYDYNVFANPSLGYRCINAGWPSVKHLDAKWQEQQLYGTPQYLHETVKWGKPMLGGGLVYNVNPDSIVYDPETTDVLERWPHLIAIDWGFTRDPAAIGLFAWDKGNDIVYVVDMWTGNCSSEREFAQEIWKMNPKLPVAYPRDGGGAKGFKSGGTIAQRMANIGVEMLPEPFIQVDINGKKNAEIEPGLVECRSRFITGRLKINQELIGMLEDVENYKYDTDGKPKARQRDHTLDSMRYGVVSILQDRGEPIYDSEYDDDWEDDDVYHQSY